VARREPLSPRLIRRVHACPGRVRLRLGWLREAPEEAEGIADALAALPGMREVRVRPFTGSVLCSFEEGRLDAEAVIAALRRETRVAAVMRSEEPYAGPVPPPRRVRHASRVASAMRESFRALDRDVRVRSDGHLDLGALTGLGFLALGAAEIVTSRRLPAPPWFNLAWMAFRTFTIFSEDQEEGEGETDGGGSGAGPEGAGDFADGLETAGVE
jgi:hypothetical protein